MSIDLRYKISKIFPLTASIAIEIWLWMLSVSHNPNVGDETPNWRVFWGGIAILFFILAFRTMLYRGVFSKYKKVLYDSNGEAAYCYINMIKSSSSSIQDISYYYFEYYIPTLIGMKKIKSSSEKFRSNADGEIFKNIIKQDMKEYVKDENRRNADRNLSKKVYEWDGISTDNKKVLRDHNIDLLVDDNNS